MTLEDYLDLEAYVGLVLGEGDHTLPIGQVSIQRYHSCGEVRWFVELNPHAYDDATDVFELYDYLVTQDEIEQEMVEVAGGTFAVTITQGTASHRQRLAWDAFVEKFTTRVLAKMGD